MADINPSLSNIRTLEDVVNMLSILFFNMNNENSIYYTMFLDPEPQDVLLRRYDEAGNLEEVWLPNRAKDKMIALIGAGDPSGTVASIGQLYIDTSSQDIWFKSDSTPDQGWIKIWSTQNLAENRDYLAPDGSGSQLHSLNANNITLGTLSVEHGGTGVGSLSGILKGRGTDSVTSAKDGIDYLGPLSSRGMICYYPSMTPPIGWFVCKGDYVDVDVYPELHAILGTNYGPYITGDQGQLMFKLPDLRNDFIRCYNGTSIFYTEVPESIKKHTHIINGIQVDGNGSHTHGSNFSLAHGGGGFGSGTCNNYGQVTGCFTMADVGPGLSVGNYYPFGSAKFYTLNGTVYGSTQSSGWHVHSISGQNTGVNNATGDGDSGYETYPKHRVLVPIIKY